LKKILVMQIIVLALFAFPLYAQAGKIKGVIKVKGLRSPAGVLVYLTKAPPVDVDLSGARFVMDQRNLTFIPHVLPILVGSTVEFPNNDKVDHNVFSLSRTRKFNLGSYSPGESKTVLFDRPGIVELRCDVHAEMLAYILVMKNPFFAVTDDQGRFEIPHKKYLQAHGVKGIEALPPGKYSVKTWHEKLRSKKMIVTVGEGSGKTTVNIDLKRGTPSSVLYK